MKHNPNATANAAAVTVGVFYILCRILVGLFPSLMFTIAEALLHGMALTPVGSWDLTLGSFILGIMASAISAWVIGYVFAISYNASLKK